MKKLFTAVEMESMPHLSHCDKMLMIGSCFIDSIGEKLCECGFNADINPFGTLYNPISIVKAIKQIREKKVYTETDLFEYQGLWHSEMHHGSFSSINKSEVLSLINDKISVANDFWNDATVLMLTFGSAFVYYNKRGKVVGNCHKLPESEFNRKRLSIDEIVDACQTIFDCILKDKSDLKITITVSPIRHFRDGLHENQLSKATLLLAVEKLKKCYPQNISYFPAYELMMDELRDYRFYADDMIHPSPLAIEYIWEKLTDACFDKETKQLNIECEKIYKAIKHRPLHPDDEVYKEFLGQLTLKINRLKEKYPYLEFKTK
jgi:hypothetical protein